MSRRGDHSKKAESIVSQRGVKMHVFEPSNRRVWTVVGRKERWINPEAGYCSCPGFYFASMHGRPGCYHLDAARLAMVEEGGTGAVERITFSDEEFYDFVLGLVSDL